MPPPSTPIGQADLRSATRDWLVDSTAVAPTVTIEAAGGDDAAVRGAGGHGRARGTDDVLRHRVRRRRASRTSRSPCATPRPGRTSATTAPGAPTSPPATAGSRRSTSAARSTTGPTRPRSTCSPGSYSVHGAGHRRRGPDHVVDQPGPAHHQRAGTPGTCRRTPRWRFAAPTDESLAVNLAGTATDDRGVQQRPGLAPGPATPAATCRPNGTMAAAFATRDATLASPGATHHRLVAAGDHAARPGATGASRPSAVRLRGPAGSLERRATASYRAYPDDGPPTLSDTLGQPQSGASFSDGQDRRHRPRRGRAGPVRQHRAGRGRRSSTRPGST